MRPTDDSTHPTTEEPHEVTTLNGRVARLERVLAPLASNHCRACGLRHVQPMTMDLARRLIGPVSLMTPGLRSELIDKPPPQLCLCDPCCGDPGDRWFARRSHRLDSPSGAA